MREIKFRAWDTFHSKIVNWEEVKDCFRGISWDTVISDYPLMQFTGFLDKNGKEVYERDIVESRWGKGQVFMRLGCWFVELQSELGYFPSNEIEIIGNIYESKHLLNNKSVSCQRKDGKKNE